MRRRLRETDLLPMTPNNSERRGRGWLSPLIHLSNNWISLAGVVIVTTATVFWLFLLPITLRGETAEPLRRHSVVPGSARAVLPGLMLIPLGIWLKRKREGRGGIYPPEFPAARPGAMPSCAGWSTSSASTTVVNIVIASQLTYGAVNYMDSVTFCGQTCHTVMQPEYTAYQNSPHSHVECVQVPHRSRRRLVRAQQALRRRPGVRGHLQHLPAPHPHAGPQPAPRARNLRSLPLAAEVRRRPHARSSPSTPRTRPTRLTKTVLLMKIGGGNNGIGIHGTHLGPPGDRDPLRPLRRGPPDHSVGGIQRQRHARPSMPRPTPSPTAPGSPCAKWTAWTATTARPTPTTCPTARWTAP